MTRANGIKITAVSLVAIIGLLFCSGYFLGASVCTLSSENYPDSPVIRVSWDFLREAMPDAFIGSADNRYLSEYPAREPMKRFARTFNNIQALLFALPRTFTFNSVSLPVRGILYFAQCGVKRISILALPSGGNSPPSPNA